MAYTCTLKHLKNVEEIIGVGDGRLTVFLKAFGASRVGTRLARAPMTSVGRFQGLLQTPHR